MSSATISFRQTAQMQLCLSKLSLANDYLLEATISIILCCELWLSSMMGSSSYLTSSLDSSYSSLALFLLLDPGCCDVVCGTRETDSSWLVISSSSFLSKTVGLGSLVEASCPFLFLLELLLIGAMCELT
jgi:hypothetical protein